MMQRLSVRNLRLVSGVLAALRLALALVVIGLVFGSVASAQTAGEWTWMGGTDLFYCGEANGLCIYGVYGTLGVPAAANIPGAREYASSWTDKSGNFWLFGGNGFPSEYIATGGGTPPPLNDLWEFSPSTNEWTWMSGSSTLDNGSPQPGIYGTLGTPVAGNTPGARSGASNWTDSSGNLWLFGGEGVDGDNEWGYLNDLWEFRPSTNEWTWMGGSSTANQPGVYGTLGTPSAGNIPGGRSGASTWIDKNGNFWLYGGDTTTVGGGIASR
jgi:hypothetical protein